MVERARHALAIDDERHTFHPLLWDERLKDPKATPDPDRIRQVWFSGAHSNVGGGYPKQGMSVVSLAWMMDEAERPRLMPNGTQRPGLRFSPADRQLYHERQNVYDKLYDSRAGLGFCYRYLPRDIDRMCRDHHMPARIHVSAVERFLDAPAGYAPGNIPSDAEIEGPKVAEVSQTITRMRAALRGQSSLLDSVRGLIRLRWATQLFVIGLAVWVTILAMYYAEWSLSECSAWDLVRAVGSFVVDAVTSARWWVAALLLAMLAAYGINWLATRRMKGIFSTFWFHVRPH
jgi:hypothetical protein